MERDMLWMYDKEENRLINEHDEEFYLRCYMYNIITIRSPV